MLPKGLYEQVINLLLQEKLQGFSNPLIKRIDHAESSDILSNYLAEILVKGFDIIKEQNKENLYTQINLINKIIELIQSETGENDFSLLHLPSEAEQLFEIQEHQNSISAINTKSKSIRPSTSLATSSLFTGAVHEPSLSSELKKEILTSDRIDILVSFIKWSGLRLIIDELETFIHNGGELRVITTSYMGATDLKAIYELNKLANTQVKISYDTKRTRLHAKSYIFHRNSGFSTAYIGSSNLSNVAISSGLEWNIKTTVKDSPATMKKIFATFESYWNSTEFENFAEDQKTRLAQALNAEKYSAENGINSFHFDIRPYPYQEEILDKLEADRKIRDQYKNLVIAATGTGKTVISAFDYKRFCQINPKSQNRLLFIAHREEILKQSISCFRNILRDPNFADLFVGNHRPRSFDHLFMSVQTFNAQDFQNKTSFDFYDYIIIDEFHHVAAKTYQKIIQHYQPKILLGLTATPERADGQSILPYFNDHISAEIRLPEAIDRKLLCPFQYFGVTDTIDLQDIKWSRGGYDKTELSKLYSSQNQHSRSRVDNIVQALLKYVTDIAEVKGLGFCVTIEHAHFMANSFNAQGIPSVALTGNSSPEERNSVQKMLITGELRFIFVVDIYNEGVDIPQVNTVLFLRPTESLTIFLQQLGRGLRLHENKECLTVLDFIGQAHAKYSFENKFTALLSNSRKNFQEELQSGFGAIPKGCSIQIEKIATEYIFSNIKNSIRGKNSIIKKISSFTEDSGQPLTLQNFTRFHNVDPRKIYASKTSFSRLCAEANAIPDFNENLEDVITSAFSRLCSLNSRRLIDFVLEDFNDIEQIPLTDYITRILNILQFTIWQKPYSECGFSDIRQGFSQLKNSPVLFHELTELLKICKEKIDFVDEKVELGFDCPLDLHCDYTRDQILVGFDFMKPNTVREGTKYLEDKKCDIFFVTLNKSEKDYSPSTMYDDYSINEELFHWQSQSTTSEHSPTGKRYINHKEHASNILLFVREFKKDAYGLTAPYTFLGTADYVNHKGSKPMSITWKLKKSIPAKFLKKTNKLMVG